MIARNENLEAKQEIEQVITDWGFARDSGDWKLLSSCFQPDATIHISWFSGSAQEFIERSAVMLSENKPGEVNKHNFGRTRIRVAGQRAVSESHVELLKRVVADPFDYDTQTWGRFYDHLEKREDGLWRIFKRTMVYEKDRMEPVNPSEVPEGFYETMELSSYPVACQFLCYRLGKNGRKPMDNIIQVHSNAEVSLRQETEHWLNPV